MVSKGRLRQLFPVFIPTKRKLIGYEMLRMTENSLLLEFCKMVEQAFRLGNSAIQKHRDVSTATQLHGGRVAVGPSYIKNDLSFNRETQINSFFPSDPS